MTICVPKGVFIFIEVLNVDFRTVSTGRFDNWHIWEYLLNGIWVRASRGNFPSNTNNVFIGHAVNLEKREQCKDFNINTSTTFDGEGHELLVHGKLRRYTGIAPGTNDPLGGVAGFMGANTTLVFKSNGTDRTVIDDAEFGGFGQSSSGGWTCIIDFGTDKAIFVGRPGAGEDLEIKTGTLEAITGITGNNVNVFLFPLDGIADETKCNLIIRSAAKLIILGRISQFNNSLNSIVLELGGIIDFKGTLTFLSAQNLLSLLGTIMLTDNIAQDFPRRGLTGIIPAAFATVVLAGGIKDTTTTTTINTLLDISGNFDVVPSAAEVIQYVSANLKYHDTVAQRLTTVHELPSSSPPTDVIIEGDVRLHEDKLILGDVIINSNELDLSLADFTGLTA